MKAKFAILLMVSFWALKLFAQEETVKIIRQDYLDYNKKLQESESGGINFMTSPFKIKTVQVRPALGPVDIEISYYFDEVTNTTEIEDTNVHNTQGTLRKIVYKESMPSYTDYREVFFDAKGNLQFYYSKLSGYTCGEKRMYFNLNKMIKIKFNPIEGSECVAGTTEDKFPDFVRYSGKFNKDDLDWEKWILKYSGFHKKAFLNLFESLQ
jgi:hypothetical protein